MVLTGGSGLVGGGSGAASSLIRQLDFQDSVIDKDLNTPPGSPPIGAKYIVAAGGTGAWAGLDDKIVTWLGSAWVVSNTNEGFMCTVEDENVVYHFTGTIWEKLGNIIDHFLLLNLQGGLAAERYHLTAAQHTSVTGVTAAEYTQLANIDTTTISIAQWGFVGAMDQGVATTDKHTMLGVDLTTGGLEDNDVLTPIELGDGSNTSFNTSNKTIVGAVNQVLASLPNANKETLTITGDGQTAFTLAATPDNDASFKLVLNEAVYSVSGTHYNRTGTALTWLDPSGLTLKTTDTLVAIYNDVGNSALSNWSDDLTDITPFNAGRNVDIGTGLLKDNDVTAGVALGESGDTALHASFTAASIVGALNENKLKETFISKAFGDSPYSAVAGDNAIAVDTSGGAVTITLPAAASNLGVRIRVSKITSDSNQVIIATTGGDTVGFQSQWTLSHQGDSATAISDGGTEWCLFTERDAARTVIYQLEYDSDLGDHRVQSVATAASQNFEFTIPADFLSVISLKISGYPAAGAAGPNKDIDLFSDYGGVGELFNIHSESDTTTLYDFTGDTDTLVEIDLSGVFASLSARDRCGIQVDHNIIGGNMRYVDIVLEYRRAG